MKSIRTKTTALMLSAILASMLAFGLIGIYFIRAESSQMSAQTLNLICENRKELLNEYLNSIGQSVNMISRYAIDSLDGIALTEGGVLGASGEGVTEIPGRSEAQRQEMDEYFDEHLALIEGAFKSVANHTNGMSSCYYRLNPEITTTAKGFFFTLRGASDFHKIELTDLTAYTQDDIEYVGWYFIPLRHGGASWIGPYRNARLDDWVISYTVPIYKAGTFIGIVGMDIRFDTLVKQVEEFTNFKTGYFVLIDEEGRSYFHPDYEMGTELPVVLPQVNSAINEMRFDSSQQQIIRYVKNGTAWQTTYCTLANGMKIAAVVEESEINTFSNRLTRSFIFTGIVLLLVFSAFTAVAMRRVVHPLQRLTAAARKLADGDYDAELDFKSNDEVGVLTDTFSSMRDRLKLSFSDLSHKAFTDDLTGVKSKHAYVEVEEKMNRRIEDHSMTEFAIVLFDLNNLKKINDTQGHEAGDRYIKDACNIICYRFKRSPIYRIGGDEFVAIIEGDDYKNLYELAAAFEKDMDVNLEQGRITVASGYAHYDASLDKSLETVFERADKKMYQRNVYGNLKFSQAAH